jgi:probable F420-dependent oxidoreductase
VTEGSSSPIKIGIVTSGEARVARQLEERGLDSLWVGGHLASTNPSPEAVVALARLAAVTERVTVGTSILLLPLYPPAIVAKQIADLDLATGGRVALGVGVGGEYPADFRAVEIPITERGRRTDEMIPLLRQLWTAEEVTHHGDYYRLERVRIHPAPRQLGGPPIIVAGRKEPAMRRAALLGDGWLPYLYSPRRYAASVEVIRNAATAAGRDLGDFEWCAFIFVNINRDGAVAREQAARTLGGTYGGDFMELLDSVAAAGDPREVIAKLCEFYDAGARHFVFLPATGDGDPAPVLDRLLGEVVPALAQHAATAR